MSLQHIETSLTNQALATWERVRSSGELRSLIDRRSSSIDFSDLNV